MLGVRGVLPPCPLPFATCVTAGRGRLLGAAAELTSRVRASQLLLEASDEPMLHRACAGWTRCLLGGV